MGVILVRLWVMYLNVDFGEEIMLFMKFNNYMFVKVFMLWFKLFVC